MTANRFFLPLTLIAAFGCDGGNDDPDAGPQVDACTDCRPDSGRADGGPVVTGDGDDSFADARPLTVGGTPQMSTVRAANDRDYYSFTATAGQWVAIGAEKASDTSEIDTVVTLYDSNMEVIAENDDVWPRIQTADGPITDSELITRIPADGTYYVLVQEYSSWRSDDDVQSVGGSSYAYEVFVGEIAVNAQTPQVNIEVESGNDVASARALAANAQAFSLVLGRFDAANDVDVYSFDIAAGGNFFYGATLMPSGEAGNGSSADPARMWITDAAGTTVIARLEPSAIADGEEIEIAPWLEAGSYRLWVSHTGELGTNAFYVLKARRATDNALETDDTMNNLPATAQALALTAQGGAARRTGFFLSRLGAADPADHFRIEVMANETVGVFCSSRTSGSGVVDLQVALTNDLGTEVLAMDTETAAEGIEVTRAGVAAGNYLVRVTKASQSAEVTGDWVRCGVSSGPPAN